MENGRQYHSERLDRIEGIIEATASRQANIEDEFVRLLKLQVALQDLVNKSAEVSNARMYASNARMDRVELSLVEAGDKLNALIALTDQHLHEHREKA